MTAISLFSGIGGFDLGFERAGIKTSAVCERDPQCRKLLAQKFPQAVQFDDVTTIPHDHELLRRADVICGGFPCQDLSVAGARAGLAGSRSGLWFAFRDIVESVRPCWVVIENVPGLLSSDEGRDLLTVISGLGQCGYRWAYRVLDAQYYGLAQRRKRVFIVASLGNYRCAEVLFEPESVCWDSPPRREAGERVASTIEGRAGRSGANNFATSGGLAEIARPLRAQSKASHREDSDTYVLAHGQGNAEIRRGGEPPLTCNHEAPILARSLNAGRDGYNDGSDQTYVCFDRTQSTHSGGISAPLRSNSAKSVGVNPGKADNQCIAFKPNQGAKSRSLGCSEHLSPTLESATAGNNKPAVMAQCVRRLTPTECERLQGFPDGWTDGFSDSTRYRMLGNAVAVPVAEWIAKRLLKTTK